MRGSASLDLTPKNSYCVCFASEVIKCCWLGEALGDARNDAKSKCVVCSVAKTPDTTSVQAAGAIISGRVAGLELGRRGGSGSGADCLAHL